MKLWPGILGLFTGLVAPVQVPVAPPVDEAARTIAGWREALELDLPAEVLGPGPVAVGPAGPLAEEGEAIALVAGALFDAGRVAEAQELLAVAPQFDANIGAGGDLLNPRNEPHCWVSSGPGSGAGSIRTGVSFTNELMKATDAYEAESRGSE